MFVGVKALKENFFLIKCKKKQIRSKMVLN